MTVLQGACYSYGGDADPHTDLELHQIHRVQILLLHVHPAHCVAHAARLLVLVFAADQLFGLLGHLRGSEGACEMGDACAAYAHVFVRTNVCVCVRACVCACV